MGRVGMVLHLVTKFVMGRDCQGPSLSWAKFVMGRDVPESFSHDPAHLFRSGASQIEVLYLNRGL